MSTAPISSRKTKKTELLSVRFDPETLMRLTKVAASQGLPVATIVRMWTLQRLAQVHPLPESEAWVTRELDLPD